MAENPPAWHPDPTGQHDHRWWDGQRWTEHVADAGVAAIDPLPSAPPQDTTAQTGTTEAETTGESSGTTPAWGAAGAAGATGAGGTAADPGSSADPTAAASASSDAPAWGGDVGAGPTPTGGEPVWAANDRGAAPEGSQPAWPGTEAGGQQAGGQQAAWDQGPPASWGDQTQGAAPTKASGMAIAALVLGILAIPSAMILIGGLFGLLAVILGAVAAGKAKRGQAGGRGVAIGGILTGAVGLVIAVVIFVAVMVPIFQATTECLEAGGSPEQCQADIQGDLMEQFG